MPTHTQSTPIQAATIDALDKNITTATELLEAALEETRCDLGNDLVRVEKRRQQDIAFLSKKIVQLERLVWYIAILSLATLLLVIVHYTI